MNIIEKNAVQNAVKKTLAKLKSEYVNLQAGITSNALTAENIPMLKDLKKKAIVLQNKAYKLDRKLSEDCHHPGQMIYTRHNAQQALRNGFEMAFKCLEIDTIYFNLVCFIDRLSVVINELQIKHYMPSLKTLPKSFNT